MRFKRFFFLFLMITIMALGSGLLVSRLEGIAPSVTTDLAEPFLGRDTSFTVCIADSGTGLRSSRVSLLKDDKEILIDQKSFPYFGLFSGGLLHKENIVIKINPKLLELTDGKAIIQLSVQDYSWRNWGEGNQNIREIEVQIDTQPPGIEVLSSAHNIAQGGAGLLVYQVSEKCQQSGVMVGNCFFPGHSGYFEDPFVHIVFFALRYDQVSGTQLYLSAFDFAGNQNRTGFPYYITKRRFKNDPINITDQFLTSTIPKFEQEFTDPEFSQIEKFKQINNKFRQDNVDRIYEIAKHSDATLHWQDSFLRLPRSAGRADFGDRRSYFYKDKLIDHQIHLGVDLASVGHSPVPAANGGKVVFADALGIYGLTVIVDHGYGLLSLYAHLSQARVSIGQLVTKGQILGDTGTSGLAIGDHLHFGMLVHTTFVNPLEWWDTKWIENNITTKLANERLRLVIIKTENHYRRRKFFSPHQAFINTKPFRVIVGGADKCSGKKTRLNVLLNKSFCE